MPIDRFAWSCVLSDNASVYASESSDSDCGWPSVLAANAYGHGSAFSGTGFGYSSVASKTSSVQSHGWSTKDFSCKWRSALFVASSGSYRERAFGF